VRLIVAILLLVMLFMGSFLVRAYREDQKFLRQHLEQRDARNREFNRRMDEVEEHREGNL